MFLQQKPIPGYWYSDFSGHLIQVRAIVYLAGKRSYLVIEDIGGSREYVGIDNWKDMDLVLHSPVNTESQDEAARDS